MERRHRFVLALFIALSALAGPLLAVAGTAPSAGGVVLVVGPAGSAARDAIVRLAGGTPVGPAQAPLAGFATSDASGFVDRLHDAGAWLVLDGDRLARICGLQT